MARLHTRADYERLPLGIPVQLIEGCLVREPAPRFGHGAIGSVIYTKLAALMDPRLVPLPPVDVAVDEHNVYQPDIVVLRSLPPYRAQYVGTPLVAMEVLSPSTAKRDRQVKTVRLLGMGVAEVWIVDWEGGTIEIHRPDGIRRFEGRESAHSDAIPGFFLIPEELFAD